MMPNDTKKSSKKIGPIVCAAIFIGILSIFLAAFIYPLLDATYGELAAFGILIVYAFLIVAVIIGIIVALRQRLKEIEGGEEEIAKKY